MRTLLICCLLSAGWVWPSNTVTNYKSGISIGFEGTQDADYAFERFYHDTLIDDHGVFYIKAATKITLFHNDLNTAYIQSSSSPPNTIIGADGEDGVPDSGDEGIIRYLIDGDGNYGYHWSDAFAEWDNPLPAYDSAFALADLTYDGSVPVVGRTGDNGTEVTDKANYYHYGMTDAFGDEWHILTVGDDDKWHASSTKSRYASDGKIFYLVVNPKTPLVSFETSGDAQFYTTPAKSYEVPKIHDQTTYVTDGVTMEFTNIMTADPVYYRFDTDVFAQYTGPVSLDALSDGEHTLEYYYNDSCHKTRTVVVNPDFPSAGETHGYMLWDDDTEYNGIVERITSADTSRVVYVSAYNSRKTKTDTYSGNHQASWDTHGMRGERYRSGAALINAFVAKVEGTDAARSAGAKTYAAYAKEMILDSWNILDPVAHGYNQNFDARPSAEMGHFGYYQVNGMLSHVPAYDLLIGMGYTSDKVTGGITPIEDLKIRDGFASFILLNLRELGGYGNGDSVDPDPDPGVGMWDMARQVGGLLAAVAMPTYDTPYYGTSGFDGTAASYTSVPFPDQALTWKQVFVDHDYTTMSYPNCRRYFNQVEGGLITAEGMFYDRPGYYAQHLMGHCFQIQATIMKITHGIDYPYMVLSFENANVGRLVGLKNTSENLDSTTAGGYGLYPQISLINEHFPTVAETAYMNIAEGKLPWNSGIATFGDLMYGAGIYGMLWFHDDWRDYVSDVDDQKTGIRNPMAGGLAVWPNPMGDQIQFAIETSHRDVSTRIDIFDQNGNPVYTSSRTGHDLSLRWDGMCINGNTAAPGMYYYRIDTGTESYTGKIFKIK